MDSQLLYQVLHIIIIMDQSQLQGVRVQGNAQIPIVISLLQSLDSEYVHELKDAMTRTGQVPATPGRNKETGRRGKAAGEGSMRYLQWQLSVLRAAIVPDPEVLTRRIEELTSEDSASQ